MDTEVDLTELDDWLGTLEELQLGLEQTRTSTVPSNKSITNSPSPLTNCSPNSHFNRTFSNEQPSPRKLYHAGRESSVPLNLVKSEQNESLQPKSPTRTASFANSHCPFSPNSPSSSLSGANEVISNGRNHPNGPLLGRNIKEATAERDLSSLLRDLEVVEERMRELEQENTTFTRRYSLASSPRSNNQTGGSLVKDGQSEIHNNNKTFLPNTGGPHASNGYISAQWAAEVNNDQNSDFLVTKRPNNCPPPPACLGAGDACVSPPVSPQPCTPSMTLLQATEAGLWCIQNNPTGPSTKLVAVDSAPGNIVTEAYTSRSSNQASPKRFESSHATNGTAHCLYHNYETQEKLMEEMKALAARRGLRAPSSPNATISAGTFLNQTNQSPLPIKPIVNSPPIQHSPQFPEVVTSFSQTTANPIASKEQSFNRKQYRDGEDDSSLSGISSWSPGQLNNSQRRDMLKSNSLAPPSANDRFSGSLSPVSSLSDKSVSDHTESNSTVHISRTAPENNHVKKLVVRIFRPDKTTKAILIEERMTAGEVASLLIEKNFLKPTTSLAVVEKVPALKIERVFEEHENVAECILSWPTGSQNMIFFEDRKDHFGFIESPKLWLGEEFAEVHRYNSSDAVQSMLNNIGQAGFPEWRDYLYIRKPGEKTWSRRLCVLRSSGLYTSKKNKKSLASTDLIRILVLDGQLQLYTTTGGWTRLRAPTPHGFAFKPYSAQDPASMHVFCFCATDEKALRQWVCRLRIAKFGRQLFLDYQNAVARIQRQIAMTYGAPNGPPAINGSLSAYVQRKSSFDILSYSSSSAALIPASSATSLVAGTGSPSIPKRTTPTNQHKFCEQRQLLYSSPNDTPSSNSPVSSQSAFLRSQGQPQTSFESNHVTRVSFAAPTGVNVVKSTNTNLQKSINYL